MKKRLIATLALFATLAITSCGGGGGGGRSSRHSHTYNNSVWESDATQHWHPATCEHTTQKGSAADHAFVEVAAERVEPTCSVPGKKVEVCSVCNYRKETPLTAEHDLQDVSHDKGEGEVTETIKKCSRDNYYQIAFNAFDDAATVSTSSDKHSKYVKLSKQVAADGTGTASYIEWKIYSPVAMSGRFWLGITGNTTNLYDRATDSGDQSLYYTFNDPNVNISSWKNEVKLNNEVVDFASAKYTIDGQEINFDKLLYSDFGTLSTSTDGTPIEVPMPVVTLNEGVNTLRMTRLTGYAFNMHTVTFKAII